MMRADQKAIVLQWLNDRSKFRLNIPHHIDVITTNLLTLTKHEQIKKQESNTLLFFVKLLQGGIFTSIAELFRCYINGSRYRNTGTLELYSLNQNEKIDYQFNQIQQTTMAYTLLTMQNNPLHEEDYHGIVSIAGFDGKMNWKNIKRLLPSITTLEWAPGKKATLEHAVTLWIKLSEKHKVGHKICLNGFSLGGAEVQYLLATYCRLAFCCLSGENQKQIVEQLNTLGLEATKTRLLEFMNINYMSLQHGTRIQLMNILSYKVDVITSNAPGISHKEAFDIQVLIPLIKLNKQVRIFEIYNPDDTNTLPGYRLSNMPAFKGLPGLPIMRIKTQLKHLETINKLFEYYQKESIPFPSPLEYYEQSERLSIKLDSPTYTLDNKFARCIPFIGNFISKTKHNSILIRASHKTIENSKDYIYLFKLTPDILNAVALLSFLSNFNKEYTKHYKGPIICRVHFQSLLPYLIKPIQTYLSTMALNSYSLFNSCTKEFVAIYQESDEHIREKTKQLYDTLQQYQSHLKNVTVNMIKINLAARNANAQSQKNIVDNLLTFLF